MVRVCASRPRLGFTLNQDPHRRILRWNTGGKSMPAGRTCVASLLTLGLAAAPCAFAEPYLALRTGLKCEACHVNPTGGGLRSDFGDVFAQTVLPAHPIRGDWSLWTGEVAKVLRIGGDLRYDANFNQTPHARSTDHLQMQQGRVYAEAEVVPNRLIFYEIGR